MTRTVPGVTKALTLRIASVPADHVYVRHLGAADGADRVCRLSDPVPDDPDPAPGQWWPPRMLAPDWVREHRAEFDVMHVQFGFDAQSAEALASLVAELRRWGKGLVYTAHDLRNPHHVDRRAHDAHLDVLVPAADEVITLTPGAAAEIRRRWGRRARRPPAPARHRVRTLPSQAERRRRVDGRGAREERAREHGPAAGHRRAGGRRAAPARRSSAGQRPPRRGRRGRRPARPGADAVAAGRGVVRGPRAGRARLLQRRGALAVPRVAGSVGAALPVRHALGMARGLLRPGHDGAGPDLRLLRANSGPVSPTGTTSRVWTWRRCRRRSGPPTSSARGGRRASRTGDRSARSWRPPTALSTTRCCDDPPSASRSSRRLVSPSGSPSPAGWRPTPGPSRVPSGSEVTT